MWGGVGWGGVEVRVCGGGCVSVGWDGGESVWGWMCECGVGWR